MSDAKKVDFQNPIDPDKVAENPGLLAHPHHIGSPVVKAEDQGKIKGRALAAMEQQTDLQLEQIKKQMELLASQARAVQDRIHISREIYQAEIAFEPLVGHAYFLYRKDSGIPVLSMVAPHEWGRKKPYAEFVAEVRLLADHTWQVVDEDEDLY